MNLKKDNKMSFELYRLKDDGDTTLGVFFVDGEAFCGTVEDQKQEGEKVYAETRIPTGTYKVALRNSGGFNDRYLKKYGSDFHKGMLCIYNKPDWVLENKGKKFQYILIHIGNDDDDSAGCVLCNYQINFDKMVGSYSGDAYKKLYPVIRDKIQNSKDGFIEITVKDICK